MAISVYISILTLIVNWPNALIERHRVAGWIKKKRRHVYAVSSFVFNFVHTGFHLLQNVNWALSRPRIYCPVLASLVAQTVKHLPTMRETWVQTLGWDDPPEREMATHSSILAWRVPWTGEPGELLSMGSLRVWHDWTTSLSLFTFVHWRRKWQPTPVFLPGESQGLGSLVGYLLWGRTESDTTEAT